MGLFDIVEFPDGLDRRGDDSIPGHVEQQLQFRLKRLLVARDEVEDGSLIGPEIEILEKQLGHRDPRTASLPARKIAEVVSVGDDHASLLGCQDVVGLVEAFKAQGVKDGVHASEVLHGGDPVLVGVEIRMSACFFEGGVVSLSGRAVDCCALEEGEIHDGLANCSADAVDEDALALGHFCSSMDHAVGGGPVERKGSSDFGINAVGDGQEVLFGDVDVLGVGVVLCQRRDEGAGLELGATRPVDGDAAGEAVARREGRGALHGVDAEAHVDIGAGEACVEDLDLDVVLGRRGEVLGDELEGGGGGAVGGDDDFAVGDGHCGDGVCEVVVVLSDSCK